MPLPAKPFSKNEAKALDLHFLRLDTADLLIMALLFGCKRGQWSSFISMEHGAPHARAQHIATSLVREVAECENWLVRAP